MEIDFDSETMDYYIIHNFPVIISSGKTIADALRDFREAAYHYIETFVSSKLKEDRKEGGI